MHIEAHRCASAKIGEWPTLILSDLLGFMLLILGHRSTLTLVNNYDLKMEAQGGWFI